MSRRLLSLLVVLAAIGVPAAILRAVCAGRSCDASAETQPARVPFCALPGELRGLLEAGFREGRSPDVLGVAGGTAVYTELGGLRMPWPATGSSADPSVPVVFAGEGVEAGAEVPAGTTLDRLAPTVAQILGVERPFPEVRSGVAIEGVAAGGAEGPRLVLLIGWKGVGSAELRDLPDEWPYLVSLLEGGAGTLDATTGSLPLDPTATLATVGTGGLPSRHGVTGSFVRNDGGEVVAAFGADAPVPVIASLADDLEESDRRTLVGLVATSDLDRGIVGGGWYPDEDPVNAIFGSSRAAPLAVEVHLSTGYGADAVPDVLGVVLDGPIRVQDRLTRRIVSAADEATRGSVLVVVAGTGTWERSRLAEADARLVAAVEDAVPGDAEAVEAMVPGGLFLDQGVLTEQQVTGQVAVDALLELDAEDGERMMADAFQGFAVSFARYC